MIKFCRSALCFILLIAGAFTSMQGQCPCMGGAPIGGISPIGGTSNTGLLIENHMRVGFLTYGSIADNHYKGFSKDKSTGYDRFRNLYFNLSLAYGWSDNMTFEAGLGYYGTKELEMWTGDKKDNGLANLNLGILYNVYHSVSKELEFTIGGGVILPTSEPKDFEYQHLASSIGAYGVSLKLFLHKGFEDLGLNLIFVSRSELYAENNNDYHYGPTVTNSVFVSKTFSDEFAGLLEIRDVFHWKDSFKGQEYSDSGMNVLYVVPQASYQYRKFNISAFVELPIINYYWGRQLGMSYGAGCNMTYQFDLSE